MIALDSPQVWVCLEFQSIDDESELTPKVVGVKTYANAVDWRDADKQRRLLMVFDLDRDPVQS